MANTSGASASFWTATAERAVRTFAQTLLASLGLDATDLLALPWERAFALAGVAAVLFVATSLLAVGTGSNGPGITESLNINSATEATTRGGNPWAMCRSRSSPSRPRRCTANSVPPAKA